MNLETLQTRAFEYLDVLKGWLASPQFYAQVIAVVVLWVVAKLLARQILLRVPQLREEPTEGRFLRYQKLLFSCRNLVEPLVFVGLMAAAAAVAFLGMANGQGRDRGPALIVEQSILPATVDDATRTRTFAWYNVLQDAGHGDCSSGKGKRLSNRLRAGRGCHP